MTQERLQEQMEKCFPESINSKEYAEDCVKVAQIHTLEEQIEMLDQLQRDKDASISAFYLREALRKELKQLQS